MKGLDSWESAIKGVSEQLVGEPVGYLYLGENMHLLSELERSKFAQSKP